jgi:hypothetical protein
MKYEDLEGAVPIEWKLKGSIPRDRLNRFGAAIRDAALRYGVEVVPHFGQDGVLKFGDLPQFSLILSQSTADGSNAERSLKEHVDTLHAEGGCSCPLNYRLTEQDEEGFDRVGLAQVVTMVSAGGLKINHIGRTGTNLLQQYFEANPLTEAERAELDSRPLPKSLA